ncbi:MAG: ATPase [Parcubacteria group bacterium]|nr:ATPase [Parcubacteria group bacterium]
MKQVTIIKQDGTKEAFDVEKLRGSLRRSGASDKAIEEVIEKIDKELKDGMTTSTIYKHAFKHLEYVERPVAAKYSMKRAILALGPSGYPFESFIGEILKAKGYKNIKIGTMIQGACVEHEVDILAEKEGKQIGAEIKFHNKLGIASDLKVALYVHSRFEDIREGEKKRKEELISEDWLITNTRFSKNAIKYSKCVGMKLISWNYPKGEGLQDMIDETGIHPITALTTLTSEEKVKLMEKKIVLCRNLENNQEALKSIGLKGQKLEDIMKETQGLCKV